MRKYALAILAVAAPLAWLFGRALTTDEMFVFRDAAHYYFPYYHYVAEQWGTGQVPLWNPQENLGQPLLADPTAAVLYPGKLIFASPLGYDTNYKLYIVAHVLLAAINAFIAARGFARTIPASTICALSYAFSGSVLFQYCNVVFLVGAAWLPLAILATQRMLMLRDWRWAMGLAVVLALMVLGGDPQLAYHTGLAAVLLAFMLWWRQRRGGLQTETTRSESALRLRARLLSNRLILLLLAGGFAVVLAAVQILPSLQWSSHTTRAATDVPRSVFELAAGAGDHDLPSAQRCAFLLGQTAPGHHVDSYQFSVGPWHLAGCVWPNCFGNLFPQNTRWVRALPAEDRMWTPTLYMGLLPLLLALSQLRFRRRGQQDESITLRTWFTWKVVFALLASFGWYSIGWLASEFHHAIHGADAAPLPLGWAWGGVYWLLQTVLPGYVMFRYPAKWLVFAALGMSMLAAYGWDDLVTSSGDRTRRFVRRALLIVLGLSMTAVVAAKLVIHSSSRWEQLHRFVADDSLFGPLDVGAAGWTLLAALVHTIFLTALLLIMIPKPGREVDTSNPISSRRRAFILLLIIVDLCLAQRDLTPTTNFPSWGNGSHVALKLQPHRRQERGPDVNTPPLRMYRQVRAEVAFRTGDRQRSGLAWDQMTLLPKYHLLHDYDLLESSQTMVSHEFQAFMLAARRRGLRSGQGRIPDVAALEIVGVEYVIAQGDRWPADLVRIKGPEWINDEYELLALSPRSRAELVYDVVILRPLASNAAADVRQQTDHVLDALDGEATAVVETDLPLAAPEGLPPRDSEDVSHPCQIVTYTPQYVELQATLQQHGLIVLADAYEPNWVCEVTDLATGDTRNEPILRTNRIMRGVWLPPGDYRVAFHYRPASFRWGGIISGLGWIALALWIGKCLFRYRRRRGAPSASTRARLNPPTRVCR